MSDLPPFSRRSFLALVTGLPALIGWGAKGFGGPRDQGIGGTGAPLPSNGSDDESDRGIGGTGVIGTIRRFGSIVVNDLRIAYPPDAAVRIDGADAAASALRIGQVVRVRALETGNQFSTRLINVTSEVVGRVEKVGAKTLTVLSQTVSLAAVPKAQRRWSVGETVAVSGLRRPDGSIVASLIEKRKTNLEQVAGPVDIAADGSPTVGRLRLTGVDPALIGQRAVLRGRLTDAGFEVARGQSERTLIGAGVSRLSIEAYVERGDNGLRLGSGLIVSGGADASLPLNRTVLAVLETGRGGGGEWRVASVRLGSGGQINRPPGGGGGMGPAQNPGAPGGMRSPNGPASPGAPPGPHGSFGAPGAASPPGPVGDFGAPASGSGAPGAAGPGGFGGPGGAQTPPGTGGPGGFGPPGGPGGFGGPGNRR